MPYQYYLLRSPDNATQTLRDSLSTAGLAAEQRWGVFSGLFGVAANELLVVTAGAELPGSMNDFVVQSEQWQATARPLTGVKCERQGLYVFRRFHVRAADVNEFVALSVEAWRTFEHAEDYASEPMGLFQPQTDVDGVVRMQLVTWYDGFLSWQASRTPPAGAAENFKRRQMLTLTTYASATRLLTSV